MKTDEIIYCSRCGEEFSVNSRYCMKCGNINYNHPDNKNMKQFENQNQEHIYQVGQGDTIKSKTAKDMIAVPTHTGNQKKCYMLNMLGFLGFMLIYALIVFLTSDFMFIGFLDSSFPLVSSIIAFIYLYVASWQIIFMKTNNPWWSALIPIYNIGVFSKITLGKAKLGLLYLVPGLNILVFFYSMAKLGKKFGYNGKLTAILFFIFIPVIAFKTNSFNGKVYLDISDKNIVEKDYKRRNNLLGAIIIFLVLGLMLYVFNNYKDLKEKSDNLVAEEYVQTAKKILGVVHKSVDEKNYSCGLDEGYKPGKNYYYHSTEVYYEYGITNVKSLIGKEAEVLILVNVDQSGKATYHMTMSDGERGFKKTLETELDKKDIIKYENIDKKEIENSNYISCSIKTK